MHKPPTSVSAVEVKPGEEVRWTWTHTSDGSYVSGFMIVKARSPNDAGRSGKSGSDPDFYLGPRAALTALITASRWIGFTT